jgi:hypothetical protein
MSGKFERNWIYPDSVYSSSSFGTKAKDTMGHNKSKKKEGFAGDVSTLVRVQIPPHHL